MKGLPLCVPLDAASRAGSRLWQRRLSAPQAEPAPPEGSKAGKLKGFCQESLPWLETEEGGKGALLLHLHAAFQRCFASSWKCQDALGGPPPRRINWRIRATHALYPALNSGSECSRKEEAAALPLLLICAGCYLFLCVCKGLAARRAQERFYFLFFLGV